MFKTLLKYSLFIAVVLTGAACSESVQEKPVAQVGSHYLYPSDISRIMPANTNTEDSAILANDYINKWIKQELMIQKANENLSEDQKDLTHELEEYRNSLIIYRYKNELVKQRMDTVVTTEQIEDFYNANKQTFLLDRSIVKAVFIKIPSELANPEQLKEMVKDDSEEGQSELRDYCMQYAKNFEIALDSWIDFAVLNRNLPENISDPVSFLTRNNLKEMDDSNYYYLVSIHDYMLTNDLAPLEFVENNIKNLILNQRKIKFLRELENNIYTEGERQKKFKIYQENE
ncbi:hypothetical protein [Maribellus sediminis]|uniref:hypothetical protein n=1 Tax=Maribellus sediminis TaxID=2696285 RepID=UPI0014302A28|nr:hypothetical protein [Maribellus sediminis]